MAIGAVSKRPAQHREQIADQQADQQVKRADAGGHEQRADHQLGAGRVLAGVHADKALEAQQRRCGHGLAFEFVAANCFASSAIEHPSGFQIGRFMN